MSGEECPMSADNSFVIRIKRDGVFFEKKVESEADDECSEERVTLTLGRLQALTDRAPQANGSVTSQVASPALTGH
jgi:hypothetical protein